MFDALIEQTLAEIDDLAELKVTLVAAWLIARKGSPTATVDATELAAVPALRRGLGFAPDLAIEAALKRAVARGTLIEVRPSASAGPRFLWAGEEARAWAAQVTRPQAAVPETRANPLDAAATALARVIESLEQLDAAALDQDERAILAEWLAQGYSAAEIEAALRAALAVPRVRSSPARGLRDAAQTLKARRPAAPTPYYLWKEGTLKAPPDGMVAFRDRAGRWPTGAEYDVIRAAIGLYGEPAAIRGLANTVSREHPSPDRLIDHLAESEAAALALERAAALPDPKLVAVQRLYEALTGLPPTAAIQSDMRHLLETDVPEVATWQAAFDYSAGQNKRDWRYVRAVALNPNPAVFVPPPANETARAVFDEYRRRVGRLDAFVAGEINTVSAQVSDPVVWKTAFDEAAAANALKWNYIKAIVTKPEKNSHAKQTSSPRPARRGGADRPGRGGAVRLPQVGDPTEAERAASQERARQQRAERARKREAGNG